MFYILADKTPVKAAGFDEYIDWRMGNEAIVCQQHTPKGTFVSTVFLGIMAGICERGLFETAIDSGEGILPVRRCSTWDEAEHIHTEIYNRLCKEEGSAFRDKDILN